MNIFRGKPIRLLTTIFSMLVSIAMLNACGGGGGSGGSDTTAGIGGTGISHGTVTGFGSILVNGRHIDDSGATVTLDDNPGTGLHGGIKQGMVVTISGNLSSSTGTATSVVYRDNLEGEVCALTSVGGITTLRVLGQTVIQDATTIVENGPINVGNIVEVSGLPDDMEQIRASFIEVKAPIDAVIEVKGRVDFVDDFTKILKINALDVNYNLALIDNNIPGGVPAVGQFVEVKADESSPVFACGGPPDTLTASKVELETEGAGTIAAGAYAEVEGFITELTAGGFKIGEQEVVTTGSTNFLPEDFSVIDLVVGAKVEAEGTSANGVLTATKISFRRNVKLESDVDILSGNTFTLVGFPGIVISTNSETTGDPVPAIGHIRVRGIEGPGNTVLATDIDVKSGTDAFLQGPVDTKVGTIITILGIDVDTNVIPEFENNQEGMISRQQFLNLVEPGTLVKVEGVLSLPGPPAIIYEEAELED